MNILLSETNWNIKEPNLNMDNDSIDAQLKAGMRKIRKMSHFWQRSRALLRGNVTDLVPHSGFFAQNIADFRPDFRPSVAQP
jgi:hypothetical protein